LKQANPVPQPDIAIGQGLMDWRGVRGKRPRFNRAFVVSAAACAEDAIKHEGNRGKPVQNHRRTASKKKCQRLLAIYIRTEPTGTVAQMPWDPCLSGNKSAIDAGRNDDDQPIPTPHTLRQGSNQIGGK